MIQVINNKYNKMIFNFLIVRINIILICMLVESKIDYNRVSLMVHHTKQKYNQLAASLVLTSSFISQKHKINKIRPIKCQALHHFNPKDYQQVFLTNKLSHCQDKINCKEDKNVSISNIDKLKIQAKILEEDGILKLGKSEMPSENTSNHQTIVCDVNDVEGNVEKSRKPNKRKIVKGRPQMHVMMKKRRYLMALMQEQNLINPTTTPLKNITHQQNYRYNINQIMNKHFLLKYISTQHQGSSTQQNLYDNFMKQHSIKLARLRKKSQNNFQRKQNINQMFKGKYYSQHIQAKAINKIHIKR